MPSPFEESTRDDLIDLLNEWGIAAPMQSKPSNPQEKEDED